MRVGGLELRWDNLTIGLDAGVLEAAKADATRAWQGLRSIRESGRARGLDEPVLWPRLPFVGEGSPNSEDAVRDLSSWAARVLEKTDVVVSFGIGGSYLGNRVLRDALLGPSWNELRRKQRASVPELRFAGYHLDSLEARALVALLASKAKRKGKLRVHEVVISKSGGTTETLAGILAFRAALEEVRGVRQSLTAVTDPGSVLGALARATGGEVLPFPEGVGGRWSVLSISGLATAAVSGVDFRAVLDGAAEVARVLDEAGGDLAKNPALLYAVLHHRHAAKGRTLGVFMPYSDRLKCISEWYVQLLAESLGKKVDRSGKVVNAGRTPIVAVGTTDMHAQTQLHQEGPRDKVVTTLDVADWGAAETADRVPDAVVDHPAAQKLRGKTFAELNTVARESNEQALASDGRPSCALVLDRLDARTLGALLYFLMATVGYEGELLDVCAYDQPGVEAYKKIMKARLG
jgi:glucose-6-phosphate isomerase